MTRLDALGRLRLPVIGAPMFLVSGIELVVAQCRAGILGAFPARNARETAVLADWLDEIREGVTGSRQKLFGVNLISHDSNARFEADAAVCIEKRTPVIITSMAAPREVVDEVKRYGGIALHDVTTVRHAEKALERGVDGLVLVCAGAGGHGGRLSPFAFVSEVRRFFDGPLVLAGGITNGRAIAAVRALGADFAYVGTRFIASKESMASDAYRDMVVRATAADITYTPFFSGIPANYLTESIRAAGLDPTELTGGTPDDYRARGGVKAWRDVWGAGQGVGDIDAVLPVGALVDRLEAEYREAIRSLLDEGSKT